MIRLRSIITFLVGGVLCILPLSAFSAPENEPPLHAALWAKDTTQARELVEKDPSLLQIRDESDRTALHVAAQKGMKDMVKLFLAKGSPVDARDDLKDTPLSTAVNGNYEDQAEIVQMLLDHGADANVKTYGGDSPLHQAAYVSSATVVRLLLDHGANANANCERGTPLIMAAQKGNAEIVKLLLDHGANANANCERGTPLIMAAQRGNAEIVKLLLDRGADLRHSGFMGKRTPLYSAVSGGNKEIVKMLLDRGADPNEGVMFNSLSPLQGALPEDRSIAFLLIDAGADVNEVPSHGMTPLQHAVSVNDVTLALYLLEKGANPNIAGWEGKTALDNAIEEGREKIATAMKEHGGVEGKIEIPPKETQKKIEAQNFSFFLFKLKIILYPLLFVLMAYLAPFGVGKTLRLNSHGTDGIRIGLATILFFAYLIVGVFYALGLTNDSEDIMIQYQLFDWILIMSLASVIGIQKEYYLIVLGAGTILILSFFLAIGPLPYPFYYNWHFRPSLYPDDVRLMNSIVLYFYHLSLGGITILCALLIRKNIKPIYRLLILLGYRYLAIFAMRFFGW